ncbi:MAG: sulfotransferase domain-containing protein [Rhodobacterales bacterium]|nr:sulfotransferase domain-containing protein [Rhodobacterales bacterium]
MTSTSMQQSRPGFIWLASYPKSGNTWFRALLTAYEDSDGDVDINRLAARHAARERLFEQYLACDGSLLTNEETFLARRTIYLHLADSETSGVPQKVHDANLPLANGQPLFPPEATAATIHLVRHPFDVAVSYAYHLGLAPDFDRCIDNMCNPEFRVDGLVFAQMPQVQSDWSSHTLSWMDMPGRRLTLRYEDMLADAAGSLTRALRVMYPDVEPDPDRIGRAVAATAFGKLKAQESATSFRERPPKSDAFFRSGTSGDWMNHLTPAQCARLADFLAPAMERLGYRADGAVDPWSDRSAA